MSRNLHRRRVAVVIALVLVAASCSSRDKATPSTTTTKATSSGIDTSRCTSDPTKPVSGDTIKLAASYPQSGPAAAFAVIGAGWRAYFKYTNDNGGVKIGGKRYKIEPVAKDDQYSAQKTAQNIDELLGPDGTDAFAVFSVLGTANNITVRDTLNQQCVPNIFAATGSPALGDPKYPWTMAGTNPVYPLEGQAFAAYLKQHKPTATVAMLVQNDDFGAAYEEGFKQAIEGTKIKVVKVEKYTAGANEVSAQVTSLAATKADAFFDGAIGLACPDALDKAQVAKWKPIAWVAVGCASKTLMGRAGNAAQGALSATNIEDPFNPQFADDPAMKLYRQKVKQYEPKADLEDGVVAYGWTLGALMVKVLEQAKSATRLDLIDAARHLHDLHGGLLLPGATISTNGDADPFLGESVQVEQYVPATGYFTAVGDVLHFEGKTKAYTPKRLIQG